MQRGACILLLHNHETGRVDADNVDVPRPPARHASESQRLPRNAVDDERPGPLCASQPALLEVTPTYPLSVTLDDD